LEESESQLGTYTKAAVASVEEAAVISAADMVISIVALLAFRAFFTDTLGLILLIEGAGIWLIGGALGLSGQPSMKAVTRIFRVKDTLPGESKRSSESGNGNEGAVALYMMTGALLFLESALLSAFFA